VLVNKKAPRHVNITESATRSRFAALFTEDEAAELVAEALDLLGIAGRAEFFGELKECLFLLLPCFDAFLDQFNENAVIAKPAVLGDTIDLPRDRGGKGKTSTDMLRLRHGTSIHRSGVMPVRFSCVFQHDAAPAAQRIS